MDPKQLATRFYAEIRNARRLDRAEGLVCEDPRFRGSPGAELEGRAAFLDYVRSVTASLSEYRCRIDALVAEGGRVFAKLRFSGLHTGPLLGHAPTGRPVAWDGAALFDVAGGRIRSVRVLGDLHGLLRRLRGQAS